MDMRLNVKALSMWYKADERQRHVFESSRWKTFTILTAEASLKSLPLIFSTPASVTLHTALQLRVFAPMCSQAAVSRQTMYACAWEGLPDIRKYTLHVLRKKEKAPSLLKAFLLQ